MKRVAIRQFVSSAPDDFSELEAAISRGMIDPCTIQAIVSKTHGDGGLHDETKNQAANALETVLGQYGGLLTDLFMSISGGCEGVITPHYTVLTVEAGAVAAGAPRLAVAVGRTRAFSANEVGTIAQVEETARVVQDVLRGGSIQDVHLVHAKAAAPIADEDVWARSRAGTALGIGIATGEIPWSAVRPGSPLRDLHLFSSVASCSAKTGLRWSEIIVLGNSSVWGGDLTISHTITADLIDLPSITSFFEPIRESVCAIFAKCEADPSGVIRGSRHTMLDDSVSDLRWARCVHGAILAAVTGCTKLYVSSRAEHQGPPGGGAVAAITHCVSRETAERRDVGDPGHAT